MTDEHAMPTEPGLYHFSCRETNGEEELVRVFMQDFNLGPELACDFDTLHRPLTYVHHNLDKPRWRRAMLQVVEDESDPPAPRNPR